MRKKIVTILAGLLLITGITLFVAEPASASWSDCNPPTHANALCLYDAHSGGGLPMIWYTSGWQHSGCQALPSNLWGRLSSAYFTFPAGAVVDFFPYANCTDGGSFAWPITLTAGHTVDINGYCCDNATRSIYFY